MTSGDHCFGFTIAGRQVIEHKDCDEYVDGTWTDPNKPRHRALITAGEKRALISAAVSLGERREVRDEERPVTGRFIILGAIDTAPVLDTSPRRPPRIFLHGTDGDQATIIGTLEQLADMAHHILSLVNSAQRVDDPPLVGSPDPTPNLVGGWCGEQSNGHTCTQQSDTPHAWHIAGNGQFVVAVWPNE